MSVNDLTKQACFGLDRKAVAAVCVRQCGSLKLYDRYGDNWLVVSWISDTTLRTMLVALGESIYIGEGLLAGFYMCPKCSGEVTVAVDVIQPLALTAYETF